MSPQADRIKLSRARLRTAMTPVPKAISGSTERLPPWAHQFGKLPLLNSVIESVQAWWSHHPLRPVAQVAGEASNAVVRPIAQRQPLSLVAGAAVIGAALAWGRPWRWLFRSALLAGLAPQLALRVVSRLPIESWISLAGAAISRSRQAPPGNRVAAPKLPPS